MKKTCNTLDYINQKSDNLLKNILCEICSKLEKEENVLLEIVKSKIEFVMQNRFKNNPIDV